MVTWNSMRIKDFVEYEEYAAAKYGSGIKI
jgi:hypothetical protein